MGLLNRLTGNAHADRDEFEPEGIIEFLSATGTLTYKDYRDRQRYAKWRKVSAAWTVAITQRRIVVRFRKKTFVDLAWTDPRIAELSVSVDDGGKFLVAYLAEKLTDDARGTVEIRVKTDDAARVVRAFKARRGQ